MELDSISSFQGARKESTDGFKKSPSTYVYCFGPWTVRFGSLACVLWVPGLCALGPWPVRSEFRVPGGPSAPVLGVAGLCAWFRWPVRLASHACALCVAGRRALCRWPVCFASLGCVLGVAGLCALGPWSVCFGSLACALRVPCAWEGLRPLRFVAPAVCLCARVASQACALCVAGRCALCRCRACWPVLCVAGGTFRDFAKGAVGTSRTRSTSTTGRAGSTARAWPGSSTIARLS